VHRASPQPRTPPRVRPHPGRLRFPFAAAVAALVICPGPGTAAAQVPAPASHRVEYSPSESGGRIRVLVLRNDTTAIEAARRTLLEAAAAIRRGDLARVVVLPAGAPDLPAVAGRAALIRCTFRPLPRGGELILLSEDGDTVAAIQRLLAAGGPRPGAS
jgi:hypothetical protein